MGSHVDGERVQLQAIAAAVHQFSWLLKRDISERGTESSLRKHLISRGPTWW